MEPGMAEGPFVGVRVRLRWHRRDAVPTRLPGVPSAVVRAGAASAVLSLPSPYRVSRRHDGARPRVLRGRAPVP
ncbi:hypothetical protein MTP06_33010 [Streptomyces sp. PLM4]|nr:hypothetical protein MTP02_27940 [Streptomyces albus]BDH69852.1 hypothetical protein MTP06_33010 [Streptomyces sp. PLM4]